MSAPTSETNAKITWHNKPSLVICFVGFMDLLGVSMILPMIQHHAVELGASTTTAGLLGSVYGFLQFFSSPVVGRWSDNVGHRIALVVCLLISGTGYCCLGMTSSLLMMFLARIPSGLLKHSQTLSKAYLADLITPDHYAEVFGQFNAASSVGFIVGPTVAGYLADGPYGFTIVAVTGGCIFFMNAVIVWCLLRQTGDQDTESRTVYTAIRPHHASVSSYSDQFYQRVTAAIGSVAAVKWSLLWDLFLAKLLLGASVIVWRSNFTLMLSRRFETSAITNGYILSYGSAISTLCGLFTGRLAVLYNNDNKLYLHMSIIMMFGYFLLLYAPTALLFAVFQSPLYFSSTVLRVLSSTLTIQRGGHHEAGTLIGLSQSTMALARTISPFIAGLSLEFTSSGPVLASIMLCIAAIFIIYIKFEWQQSKEKVH